LRILALDTATEICSVALLTHDSLRVRELPAGGGHSAHILPLVQALLAESGHALKELDCIAFGRGPGGFTGVRLAASVTQGLAFGAGLPVVPISDLLAVAQQALDRVPGAASVLVCNDARMQEVYWSCALRDGTGLAVPATPERVGPPDTVELPLGLPRPVTGAGRGFAVWPQLAPRLDVSLAPELAGLLPRAREIARLAVPQWLAGQAVAAELAQPVYLRNDVAKPSRK
jgi:tRNA threonylcarbamoyladenosine biosynthesis protein TsaB